MGNKGLLTHAWYKTLWICCYKEDTCNTVFLFKSGWKSVKFVHIKFVAHCTTKWKKQQKKHDFNAEQVLLFIFNTVMSPGILIWLSCLFTFSVVTDSSIRSLKFLVKLGHETLVLMSCLQLYLTGWTYLKNWFTSSTVWASPVTEEYSVLVRMYKPRNVSKIVKPLLNGKKHWQSEENNFKEPQDFCVINLVSCRPVLSSVALGWKSLLAK